MRIKNATTAKSHLRNISNGWKRTSRIAREKVNKADLGRVSYKLTRPYDFKLLWLS